MYLNCVIVTQITNETETRGKLKKQKMKCAYCEAMTDAIRQKNKTVPHATK